MWIPEARRAALPGCLTELGLTSSPARWLSIGALGSALATFGVASVLIAGGVRLPSSAGAPKAPRPRARQARSRRPLSKTAQPRRERGLPKRERGPQKSEHGPQKSEHGRAKNESAPTRYAWLQNTRG